MQIKRPVRNSQEACDEIDFQDKEIRTGAPTGIIRLQRAPRRAQLTVFSSTVSVLCS